MAKRFKVCIDPGHGGSDPGAVSGKRYEKDDVLRLAIAVKPLLERQGISVLMTRTVDSDVTIATRTAAANKANCDYFLSIHRDAASASAKGAGAWIWSKADKATAAQAQAILSRVVAVGPMSNRGVMYGTPQDYADFGVNSMTEMASALLEVGFITNVEDNRKFDVRFDEYAHAIAAGVCDALGIKYVETPSTPAESPSDDGWVYRVYEQIGAYSNADNAREAMKGKKALVRYESK